MAAPAEIDAATLQRLLAAGEAVLIDVRDAEEFADERIPGARLMPLSEFEPRRLAEAAAGRAVVLYCLTGRRSAQAAAALAPLHVPVLVLRGGISGLVRGRAADGKRAGSRKLKRADPFAYPITAQRYAAG